MSEELKLQLWLSFVRGVRVTVGYVLGAAVAHFSQQPMWVALGPIVNGIGKFLREKFKLDWLPI